MSGYLPDFPGIETVDAATGERLSMQAVEFVRRRMPIQKLAANMDTPEFCDAVALAVDAEFAALLNAEKRAGFVLKSEFDPEDLVKFVIKYMADNGRKARRFDDRDANDIIYPRGMSMEKRMRIEAVLADDKDRRTKSMVAQIERAAGEDNDMIVRKAIESTPLDFDTLAQLHGFEYVTEQQHESGNVVKIFKSDSIELAVDSAGEWVLGSMDDGLLAAGGSVADLSAALSAEGV